MTSTVLMLVEIKEVLLKYYYEGLIKSMGTVLLTVMSV